MRKNSELKRIITESWTEIHRKARTIPCTLPKNVTLLGSSTKTEYAERLDTPVSTRVVYGSPAREALYDDDPRTTCAFASLCEGPCLGHKSGILSWPHSKNARVWKTTLRFGNPRLFREKLLCESLLHVEAASKTGMLPAIRPDGATDHGDGVWLAKKLQESHWPGHFASWVYDYTKHKKRMMQYIAGKMTDNYHLTFSHSGTNMDDCTDVLNAGGQVAIVFDSKPGTKKRAGEPIPDTFMGHKVLDGDYLYGDARFLDPEGPAWIGLRFKYNGPREEGLAIAGKFVVRMSDL